MKRLSPTYTIGFSTNTEAYCTLEKVPGSQKGRLTNFLLGIGGSATNIATCLKNCGANPNLIVLKESKRIIPTDEHRLFEIVLNKLDVSQRYLRILSKTPLAIFPISKDTQPDTVLFGQKAKLISEAPGENSIDLIEAYNTTALMDGMWRIASGVDGSMIKFTISLFGGDTDEHKGRRILNPHYTICGYEDLDGYALKEVASRCDLFFLNQNEFKKTNMSLEEFHDIGPSIIIITNEDKGGLFSLRNQSTNFISHVKEYKAVQVESGKEIFPSGAGDWMLGTVTHSLTQRHKSLDFATMHSMVTACSLGAKVSAKKITMQGSANGPKISDFEKSISALEKEQKGVIFVD